MKLKRWAMAFTMCTAVGVTGCGLMQQEKYEQLPNLMETSAGERSLAESEEGGAETLATVETGAAGGTGVSGETLAPGEGLFYTRDHPAPSLTESGADGTTSETSVEPLGLELDCMKEVNVYSYMTVGDLITDCNVTVERNLDAILDTDEIGEHTIVIPYNYQGKLYRKSFTYEIVDNEAPILFTYSRNIQLKNGWAFDPAAYVSYGDNADPSPTVGYSGHLDTSTNGTYAVVAYVEDASGNRATWNMNINVVNTIQKSSGSSYTDTRTRIPFSSLRDTYTDEGLEYGIDVSKWQGNIDFEAVKNAGCDFVIMRIGHHGTDLTMDTYYEQNMKNAKAAGLKVGVYLYTTDNTEEGAREHARWIVEQLDGARLDFPIVFDWENWEDFQQYGISLHELNEVFNAFHDELAKYGYSAMLYSSKNYLEKVWTNVHKHPVWLANYVSQTEYAGDYVMWQFSSCGRIDGIAGDVDLDLLYTDRITWE